MAGPVPAESFVSHAPDAQRWGDSFPANPSGAALWHPHAAARAAAAAAAAAAAIVKVAAGGGRLEERLAP